MLKIRLTLILLCCVGVAAMAQIDSTATKDTSNPVLDLRNKIIDNVPSISIDENDLGDGGTQNIASLLTAGRDPFYSATSFNFSAARFRIKGYDNDNFQTYMNGIPMDILGNGFTPYGQWGGLNDVMRNKDVSWGLKYNTFAFGGIGANTNIDARASRQRAQTSISYAVANRSYRNRLMFTHSTGLTKKGWAFSVSGSKRWADEGYVPGTYYDGYSYFVGVDKKLGQNNLLSLVAFGAPTENGRQGASVPEMLELAGTNFYNPNWGYQNGEKRNARIGRSNQPVFILTHELRLNNKTTLTTAAGYSFGKRSTTALDWYNAADPRPDYYRYLPSYTSTWASTTDQAQGQQLYDMMKNDINLRQINWQRLYDVNRDSYESIMNADGIPGNTVSGRRSHYIIEERIIYTTRFNANSVLNTKFGDHVDFTAGASYQTENNHFYKTVNDLLGGDFYVNVNQFAERDFPVDNVSNQYDLDHPNRILKVGDKFGYDYNIDVSKAAGWAQGVFQFNKVDFFLAGTASYTKFYYEGLVRNGLFPDNSLGKGTVNDFFNYAGKGGVTYKINGRNYIFANGSYQTRAPYYNNVYISPRTRNTQQTNLKSETIQTAETGYIMNSPKLKIRLSGYYTMFKDGMDVMSFYHDSYQNFVNYAISGIDKLHFGGEFGIEANVTPTITVNAAAAVGRYYYNSNQNAVITVDNSSEILGQQIIYAKNFRIPSTPMEAYNLGVTYRSPKFWFASLTGNYFDQSYLSFNPIRRTWDALKFETPGTAAYSQIFDQTKFDADYTIDFFGGYSWKLPKAYEINHKSTFLVFLLGVNNILNNKDLVTGGYEQLRYDAQAAPGDPVNVGKFPPRFYYAYGLNFFGSITLRF